MKIKDAFGLDSKTYTILVVDEDEGNLELISARLEMRNGVKHNEKS